LTTGIHALIAGNWIVEKKPTVPGNFALFDLVPSLPDTHKLVRCRQPSGEISAYIESDPLAHMYEVQSSISMNLFELLTHKESNWTTRNRIEVLQKKQPKDLETLENEIFNLWQQRMIILSPGEVEFKI